MGGIIYVLLREHPPNALTYLYELLNTKFTFTLPKLPLVKISNKFDWVVYNLPDALWAFSLISFVVLATRTDSRNNKLLYLFMSVVIMLILEITVGTFDWLDLAAMFIGSGVSIAMMRRKLRN